MRPVATTHSTDHLNNTLLPRRHLLFAVCSLAAICFSSAGLLGCAKEKSGSASTSDPAASASAPAATASSKAKAPHDVRAPTIALGANRTEMMAGTKSLAKTDEYSVVLLPPSSATEGQATTAKVTLIPAKGWKLNQEFPYSLKIAAPEGVTLEKAKQGKSDATEWDKKATWDIAFTSNAGSKSFKADFSFAVCTNATCNPHREKLAFVVNVK